MPLTSKGKKIMKAMKEKYGKKKGESVFYASRNKGKIKGVEKVMKAFRGAEADTRSGKSMSPNTSPSGSTRSGGRDPSKQYQQIQPGIRGSSLTPGQRQTLTQQQNIARGRVSPSTTTKGKIVATAIGAGIGIPFVGGKIGSRIVDYTMGFSPAMARKKPERKIGGGNGDRGSNQKIIKPVTTMPIEANKPIDTSLINPKDNFFNFVAYNMGGLSGGIRSGPPPKRGPNPNVPPVKMKKGGYKK